MGKLHVLAAILILLVSSAGVAATGGTEPAPGSRIPKAAVSSEVKSTARKLAHAWVDTASMQTLDQLSNRSIAFAGMVPGLYVVLDGKRLNAGQALIDSALTIIKSHTNEEDAAAIRNTVYVLMEIAGGRATRGRK